MSGSPPNGWRKARKERIIELCGQWLKSMANGSSPVIDLNETDRREFTDILRSYYLFEKESRDYALAKAMISKAGLDRTIGLWPLLIKLKIFDEDENLDLLRFDIAVDFDDTVLESAAKLVSADHEFQSDGSRRDLTSAIPVDHRWAVDA